ncbi:epidermal growth factor-like protein 7 [Huso huso]|uniref:Epidermal growth factor-like protein 7 n=1 Tax=Huso huso TaxID=61971 RepID=A0ABR0Z8D4_HUSHU
MHQALLIFTSSFLILPALCTNYLMHPGRRVCYRGAERSTSLSHTESFVQPVYKPYLTVCEGHRLCSTYRTSYRVSYRQIIRKLPSPMPECCPGWRRVNSHSCNQAVCAKPCANGGTCVKPNRCACPPGWTGSYCRKDVDECSSGTHACAQQCQNIAGSYQCGCREGYLLSSDKRSCEQVEQPVPNKTTVKLNNADEEPVDSDQMKEEVQDLRSRVEVLEKKLQLALAPLHSFTSLFLEEGLAEQTSLLSYSFQQLDRIDSLSEQIGFLEERLETCSCRDNR